MEKCNLRVIARENRDRRRRKRGKIGNAPGFIGRAEKQKPTKEKRIVGAICFFEGCGRKVAEKAYCSRHYRTAVRKGLIGREFCSLVGCGSGLRAQGLCGEHYKIWMEKQPK
jgi:hypothetical protein